MLTESLLRRDEMKRFRLDRILNFPKRVKKALKNIEDRKTLELTNHSTSSKNDYVFDELKQQIIPINGIEICQDFKYISTNTAMSTIYQGNCQAKTCKENLQFKLFDDTLCKRYGKALPMAPVLKE